MRNYNYYLSHTTPPFCLRYEIRCLKNLLYYHKENSPSKKSPTPEQISETTLPTPSTTSVTISPTPSHTSLTTSPAAVPATIPLPTPITTLAANGIGAAAKASIVASDVTVPAAPDKDPFKAPDATFPVVVEKSSPFAMDSIAA